MGGAENCYLLGRRNLIFSDMGDSVKWGGGETVIIGKAVDRSDTKMIYVIIYQLSCMLLNQAQAVQQAEILKASKTLIEVKYLRANVCNSGAGLNVGQVSICDHNGTHCC